MMRKNSMTLLGAAILASAMFFVINNSDMFSASVLSLQEKQFIVEKGRDIAYKTNSGYVDIFMAETLETPASIYFTVIFDKDTITIDPANLSGQGERSYSNTDESTIMIKSQPNELIDKSQSIIMLPFTGDIEDILLSEALAEIDEDTKKDLSIGSLNEITSHSTK